MCEPHVRYTMSSAPRDAPTHVSRHQGGVTVRPAPRRRASRAPCRPWPPPTALSLQVRRELSPLPGRSTAGPPPTLT